MANVSLHNAAGICLSPACLQAAAEFTQLMAPTWEDMDPCTQFDEMVCYGFKDRHDPGTDTLSVLADRNYRIVNEMVEMGWEKASVFTTIAGQQPEEPTVADEQNYMKMTTHQNACLAESTINDIGPQPLMDLIMQIDSIWHIEDKDLDANITDSDYDAINKAIFFLQSIGVTTIVGVGLTPDLKTATYWNPEIVAPTPFVEKSVYGNPDQMTEYAGCIADAFIAKLYPANVSDELARDVAQRVAQFEEKLAGIVAGVTDAQSVVPFDDAVKMAPMLGLDKIIDGFAPGLKAENVSLQSTQYLGNVTEVMHSVSKGILQSWMVWRAIGKYADYVVAPGVERWKKFSGKKDTPSTRTPRWSTCIRDTDKHLRFITANFFLRAAFDDKNHEYGETVLNEIRSVFKDHVGNLTWMTDDDKNRTVQKANNVHQWVGFLKAKPNMKDPMDVANFYESYNVTDSYFSNAVGYEKWYNTWQWAHAGQPFDRDEYIGWLTPSGGLLEGNANYFQLGNSVNMLPGVIQGSLFNSDLPGYISYGGLGFILGHELTHGFDTKGSTRDPDRVEQKWWDDQTKIEFDNRTECFINQYSEYTVDGPDGTLHVDGKATVTENIADAGGITLAYDAWLASAVPDLDLPGLQAFTHEQLFFIAYGNVWCNSFGSSHYSAAQLASDNHSPSTIRIKGGIANSKGFREAFDCPVNKAACELW